MFRRRRPQADFDAEIEAHLQIEIDRLRENGLSPEEAEAAARRVFGNLTAVRERYYERGRPLFWDRLAQDVRFALRLLALRPILTAAIVATLALGIGMALIVAGTSLGLLGAVALSRTLASLLFAVSPFDPATYGSVAGVLGLVAGVSAYIPSRGAAKVDPLVALRDE